MSFRPLLFVLAIAALSLASAQQRRAAQAPDIDAAVQRIVALGNAFRGEQGRPPLAVNGTLTKTAADFAAYMARTEKFGHEADGSTPSQRAERQNYDYCIVSENIGYQFRSSGFSTEELAATMVQGWKDSPRHREALLDGDVTETGVGIARNPQSGRYYAVQMFGRPRADAIDFRVTNRAGVAVRYEVDGQSFSLPPRASRSHQQCRVAQIALQGVQGQTTPLRISGGERFDVVREGGQLRLAAEQASR